MSFWDTLKLRIPKKYLVFVAALVWTFAGGMLLWKGLGWQSDDVQYLIILHIFTGITGGILFYIILFSRVSHKHLKRIFLLNQEKPSAFSFFDLRSYLLMALMISCGIVLRTAHFFNMDNLGTFYIAMGIPLLFSAFRFWNAGLYYRKTYKCFSGTDGFKVGKNGKLRRWLTILLRLTLLCYFLIAGIVLYCNFRILFYSAPFLYDDTAVIPENSVGIVLGTSKNTAHGFENLFFKFRIEAAAELYKSGKIKYIILSGDNGSDYYNEPRAMKIQLMALGVPSDAIYLDYAGFRTLDSMLRCKEIFGQQQFTVISQEFQNERAVFIARHYGIDAIALNARDVKTYSGFKTNVRELFARVKVFIDLYVTNAQPKYLGEKIHIGK
ncbi:MAG: ElyC/SanA/YdcF family protein [Bacteroidota bacterium]